MQTAEVVETEESKEIAPFGMGELTRKNLALLKEQSDAMVITDNKSYVVVKDAHIKAKGLVTAVTARHKERKASALAECQKFDSDKREILALVGPIVSTLAITRKGWDDKKADEKAEKARIEQARVDAIHAKINSIRQMVTSLTGMDSLTIRALIDEIDRIVLPVEVYHEFITDANRAQTEARTAALTALESAEKQEAEDAARKAEAIRLEKIRLEQEAEAARLKKAEADQKAKADALKLEQEKEFAHGEAILENQRLDIAAQQKAVDDEKARIEAEKKAEVERKEREEFERKAQAEAKAKAEQDAKEQAQCEELDEIAAALQREVLRVEKEKAEAAEVARQESLKPDREKMNSYFDSVLDVQAPEIPDEKLNALLNDVLDAIGGVIEGARQEVEAL